MDEKERTVPEAEAYEPPAIVEVGSVSSLTGQDGSTRLIQPTARDQT